MGGVREKSWAISLSNLELINENVENFSASKHRKSTVPCFFYEKTRESRETKGFTTGEEILFWVLRNLLTFKKALTQTPAALQGGAVIHIMKLRDHPFEYSLVLTNRT